MNKQTKKFIINIVILLLVTGLTVALVLKDDPEEIVNALKTSKISFVFICVGLGLLNYLINSLILVLLTRIYKEDYKYSKGFFNDMVGRFFSGITPSSTGGQFAQAYMFNKQGVPLTSSASILVMMFLVYEFSLVIFSTATLIYGGIMGTLPTTGINFQHFQLNIISLSIIGFAISFTLITLTLVLSFNKRIHRGVVNFACKLGKGLHIIKKDKVEEKRNMMNLKVETFRIEIKRLLSNGKVLFFSISLYLLGFIVYNSIPFFAVQACGAQLHASDFITSLTYSNYTYLITQMIPIPGSSGGAEYVFDIMYSGLVSNRATLRAAILVWRFASFYFGLFLGAIIFVFYHESPKMETLHYSSKTLLEIEVIHLNEQIKPAEKKEPVQEPIKIENVEDYFNKIKEDLAETLKANNEALEKEQRARKRRRRVVSDDTKKN